MMSDNPLDEPIFGGGVTNEELQAAEPRGAEMVRCADGNVIPLDDPEYEAIENETGMPPGWLDFDWPDV
jgi:hypothetical protein